MCHNQLPKLFYFFKNILCILFFFIIFTASNYAEINGHSNLDLELINAMRAYHVPVVGYAIIENNKIISSNTLSIDPKIKTSLHSLFQAASISKSVSAYGALKLVSEEKLKLDESVNDKLITWKIPINKFNEKYPVTLRQLLDMTSGLSVSGFPGHAQGEQLPTLQEVLEGKLPANTPAVRVFYQPGSQYFYSGGAFQVLEQLMEDVTKHSFQEWMKKEILKPLQMNNSIYLYPLNEKLRNQAVPGFLEDGTMIKGGWNNYAIYGAGGLWSTPTDLAKFAISVSNAYLGKNNNIVAKKIAKEMLTRQKNTDYGLGFVVNGDAKTLNFRKAGHNAGYHNELLMFPNSGQGVIIMTNSENGEYIINFIIPIIAKKYHWPCYFPFFDELIEIPEYAC